jgi:hypothetical protein
MTAMGKCYPYPRVITEIQINSQPCKGINLTTRHTQARRAPQVAKVHDTVKESSRVLPHPSAVFHAYASVDTPWLARTLSHCKVSSNSVTHDATQFVGPHKSHMRQYTIQTYSPGPDDRSLINTGGGYHLGAPNL